MASDFNAIVSIHTMNINAFILWCSQLLLSALLSRDAFLFYVSNHEDVDKILSHINLYMCITMSHQHIDKQINKQSIE